MEGFVLLDTGAWSLVPPLLALALALITKEVYSSLLIGIVSGLLIYQFSLAGVGLEQTIDGYACCRTSLSSRSRQMLVLSYSWRS